MLCILGWGHGVLRIIWCPIRMHGMHGMLLIAIPIRRVGLRVLGHHGPHLLWVERLIARVLPHGRWDGGVGAFMPPRRRLHGHGVLPILMMILLHDC